MHDTTGQIPGPSPVAMIAIDGGGTRCRLALRLGECEERIEVGSANVTSDYAAALRTLHEGLARLRDRAGMSASGFAKLPVYAGLAGVTGPEMAARVAGDLPFEKTYVEDDRPAALRGALGGRDGVVAHCGTGSFLAAQIAGERRFAGGWGPVLGDPASAQWVGRRALSVTLDTVDGLLPPSPLTQDLTNRFGGAARIVAFAATARPTDFGALAPLVTEAASAGDPNARAVMAEAAESVALLLPRMGWAPGMALCLTGGIGRFHAPYLPEPVRACLVDAIGDPLSGALSLARDFAGVPAQDNG